eukprot:110875-Prymnesium_polylepis.2
MQEEHHEPQKDEKEVDACRTRACGHVTLKGPRATFNHTIARQEGRRTAEWGGDAGAQRATARPEQHRVKHRNANRPRDEHHESCITGRLILSSVAIKCEVDAEACRRTGHHQEGKSECRWQDAPCPSKEHCTDISRSLVTAPPQELLHHLPANKARGKLAQEDDRPCGAVPNSRAVVTQAGGWDEHVLEVSWHLKQVDPSGELL